MNKGPKNVTMLDVLDAIHDPDVTWFIQFYCNWKKNTFDYTVKITRKQFTLDSLSWLKPTWLNVKKVDMYWRLLEKWCTQYNSDCRGRRWAFEIQSRNTYKIS